VEEPRVFLDPLELGTPGTGTGWEMPPAVSLQSTKWDVLTETGGTQPEISSTNDEAKWNHICRESRVPNSIPTLDGRKIPSVASSSLFQEVPDASTASTLADPKSINAPPFCSLPSSEIAFAPPTAIGFDPMEQSWGFIDAIVNPRSSIGATINPAASTTDASFIDTRRNPRSSVRGQRNYAKRTQERMAQHQRPRVALYRIDRTAFEFPSEDLLRGSDEDENDGGAGDYDDSGCAGDSDGGKDESAEKGGEKRRQQKDRESSEDWSLQVRICWDIRYRILGTVPIITVKSARSSSGFIIRYGTSNFGTGTYISKKGTVTVCYK
jgi:hypothetical protein